MASRSPFPSRPKIRTTADLARHTGLSRATVSRILNGHAGIRPGNVERVMALVRETGFSPNPYSRILRKQRSATIAVCISSFRFPTVVLKLSSVVQGLVKAGYTALVESREHIDHADIRKWILGTRAEAVLFLGQHHGSALIDHVRELEGAGIPHVFCNDTDDPRTNVVTIDRARGMDDLTTHLLDLGHREIGLMGIEGPDPYIAVRLRGLQRALRRRGLDPSRALVHLPDPPPRVSSMIFGREMARRFAAEPHCPTAFAALNDEVAFGAIEGFRVAGLPVPRDVSIVGFDNADIAQVASPSITTVDGMIAQSGAAAVEFLLEQLERPGKLRSGCKRLLRPELRLRDSSGPVRKARG